MGYVFFANCLNCGFVVRFGFPWVMDMKTMKFKIVMVKIPKVYASAFRRHRPCRLQQNGPPSGASLVF